MAEHHILVVDDDESIRELVATTLSQYGFSVDAAEDGQAMFACIEKQKPDLIVLDLMLPGDNGLSLCKQLDGKVPVLMLTAMGSETDRIIGLEMGADDYLAKPFNPRELIARIKAILRRVDRNVNDNSTQKNQPETLSFSGWRLVMSSRQLFNDEDVEVMLSAGEYDLLCAFIQNPQTVLSRDALLEMTKNRALSPFDRSIDVQISRLRQKIEIDPKKPVLIKTVRGGGYLFTSTVNRE